ncbi:Nuclear RNA export factor 1 [Chionoecetes opilio]|uniref:Nuclear RNA export factor 1 n=1 Tax=Chionoecetes opilio TaxID=41210 RepID=A0A8J5D452_CHIOP|nr:Nuclear RNA export factor 1 [Chionoecetes opilio]
MGKKSRRVKRQEAAGGFVDEDDIMGLAMNGDDKPRNAKQSAKLRKKLRKQKRREKEQGKNQPRGNQKAKSTGWHKIEIIGSEAMEKTFIYTSIGSSLELEFQPLGFHKIDNMCCFYLENNEPAATAMHSLSKRIQDNNGNLLKINSMVVSCPNLALNADQLQVLREVMSRRYNTASSLLDLTDLHHDSVLLEKDILAPLSASLVMKQVVRVIKDNIPDLKALNVCKNNLRGGDLCLFPGFHSESSQLRALNLEHNAITNIQDLKHFKMFPISELSLQFNPVVEPFKNKPLRYIELAKKILVHLKLLDGVDVETYLAKGGESQGPSAPSSSLQPSASSSTAGSSASAVSEPIVRSFLEQYYALIDAPDRNNLLAAYTPDAVLEIKSNLAAIVSSTFVGQENIKKALATFPRTQHQHNTFSFNIQFPNPRAAQAVVMGQCQINGLDAAVTFTRTLTIVPFNAGLCCSQDVLELR